LKEKPFSEYSTGFRKNYAKVFISWFFDFSFMPQTSAANDDARSVNRHLSDNGRGKLMESYYDETYANMNRRDLPYRPIGRGSVGAFGTFTVTADVSGYCGADLFSEKGLETEVYVMFSNLFGGPGSTDVDRRTKGFDLRFYTRDGDWDLLGNNTPVSSRGTRNAIGDSDRGDYTADQLWRHCASKSNMTHVLTALMSDRGIPATYCHMHGYGARIYSTVNDEGERFWVRYHLRTDQGIANISDEEAKVVSRFNPHSHSDDLHDEIESGSNPSWTMYMQIMDMDQLRASEYDPFDPTRVWSHREHPMIEVGSVVLERNPQPGENMGKPFFDPANTVPGVGLSPSPDQLQTLGSRIPGPSDPYGLGDWTPPRRRDDYTQPGNLFRMMSENQKCELVDNTVRRIADLHPGVVFRHTVHCYRADADYGGRIADELGISVYDIEDLADLEEDELLGITEYD